MYLNMSKPKISVCVPTHDMPNGEFFLARLEKSLANQTFKDYELVITKDGKMAENTNSAIKQAQGEIVKVLYMDDYFYSEDALQHIADNFKGGWMVSGCIHDYDGAIGNPHFPKWSDNIRSGNNTIGSPSVLAFENNEPLLFDENLSWLLDCELYDRLHKRYGEPTILNYIDIAMGVGAHQTTNLMSDDDKRNEYYYVSNLYPL